MGPKDRFSHIVAQVAAVLYSHLECDIMAALGSPVVPEVYT